MCRLIMDLYVTPEILVPRYLMGFYYYIKIANLYYLE